MTRDQLEAHIEQRKDALVEKLHVIEDRLTHTKDKLESAVSPRAQHEQHPWRSVGLAVGAGFVLGLWF